MPSRLVAARSVSDLDVVLGEVCRVKSLHHRLHEVMLPAPSQQGGVTTRPAGHQRHHHQGRHCTHLILFTEAAVVGSSTDTTKNWS